jgi:uncharacterized protein (DUF2267 family)
MSIPSGIAHSVQQTQEWLKGLRESGDYTSESEALAVLRAVLHQLRDRLPPEEAVDLGAQLPLIVRGIYYEGWRPSKTPEILRSKEQFLDGVATKLAPHPIEPEAATRNVFSLLSIAIDQGEVAKVLGHLPATLRKLWPGYTSDWYAGT